MAGVTPATVRPVPPAGVEPVPWYISVQDDPPHPMASDAPVRQDGAARQIPGSCTGGWISHGLEEKGGVMQKESGLSAGFGSKAGVAGEISMDSRGADSVDGGLTQSRDLAVYARAKQDPRARVARPVKFSGFEDLDLKCAPARSSNSASGEVYNQSVADPQAGQIVPASYVFDLNIEPSCGHCASTSEGNGNGLIQTVPDSSNEATSQAVVPCPWKTRNCIGKGPDRREKTYQKPSALEQALMNFADRNSDYIISPDIGTEFDNCDEAYEYYNLYSWEVGFGIRYGKKRHSDNRENRKLPLEEWYQLGQEFLCSCAGRPVQNLKTTSNRTNCPAKLRLGRTSDHGWIVVEHVTEHNHPLTTTYGEKKHWPSHSRLDKYTKDLVRMLRQNNIGITKLYSILGTFFGKMENVPTTKRCLKTLCQKINREQADDDIRKTLGLFSQFMKDDPGFKYVVDPDDEGRIRTLMWTNSRSIMQYEHFGDAITFDTKYKTNFYEMAMVCERVKLSLRLSGSILALLRLLSAGWPTVAKGCEVL